MHDANGPRKANARQFFYQGAADRADIVGQKSNHPYTSYGG